MSLRLKKAPIPATKVLIAINLIFFAFENFLGGSENIETLYYLGALVPGETFGGQEWRLLTANFLHFGWLHLATNMLGLYWLGRWVELQLGVLRYFSLYLVSGIGSMFLFTIVAMKLGDVGQVLVGASAAIMGLIGSLLFLFIKEWTRSRSRFIFRRIKLILLIIGIQFLFDFIHPNVSFISHFLGLILGFSFAFLLSIFEYIAVFRAG